MSSVENGVLREKGVTPGQRSATGRPIRRGGCYEALGTWSSKLCGQCRSHIIRPAEIAHDPSALQAVRVVGIGKGQTGEDEGDELRDV
jgi:hypothetical protein